MNDEKFSSFAIHRHGVSGKPVFLLSPAEIRRQSCDAMIVRRSARVVLLQSNRVPYFRAHASEICSEIMRLLPRTLL